MKPLIPRLLDLPLRLLAYSIVIPLAILSLVPDQKFLEFDPFYWFASFIYLSAALAAIRLTLQQLIELGPRANSAIRNSSPEADVPQTAALVLQGYATSAQLLLIGVAQLSLTIGEPPSSIENMLLFISLRLGVTLLMLGGLVLVMTHFKMRDL